MRGVAKIMVSAGLLVGLAACSQNRPGGYSEYRPPIENVHEDDAGLQSKDLLNTTDLMLSSLMASPRLRQSPTQWTLVVDRVEDRTLDRQFLTNYDIFIESLRTAIGKQAQGQVTLVENKAKLGNLRGRELDMPAGSEFGQGGGAVGMGRMQPQYALYAKAFDLPNRATNTYMLQFTVVNLQTGEQIWTDDYKVKTGR